MKAAQKSGTIAPETKSQIKVALAEPGASVRTLAKRFGVSRWSIYQIQKKWSAEASSDVPQTHLKKNVFLEVNTEELVPCPCSEKEKGFSKVLFVRGDTSVTLEGHLKTDEIVRILTVLGGSC